MATALLLSHCAGKSIKLMETESMNRTHEICKRLFSETPGAKEPSEWQRRKYTPFFECDAMGGNSIWLIRISHFTCVTFSDVWSYQVLDEKYYLFSARTNEEHSFYFVHTRTDIVYLYNQSGVVEMETSQWSEVICESKFKCALE